MGSFTPNAESGRIPSTRFTPRKLASIVRLTLPRQSGRLHGFGGGTWAACHCAPVKKPSDIIRNRVVLPLTSPSNSSQNRTKKVDWEKIVPCGIWLLSGAVRIVKVRSLEDPGVTVVFVQIHSRPPLSRILGKG